MTRSVFLGNELRQMLMNTNFRLKFFEMVLRHNMAKIYRDQEKCTVGGDLERKYVEGWLNAILEDAILTGIQMISEVNWSSGLRQCLGRQMDLVLKQYQRFDIIISTECEIEVDELIRQEDQIARQ